MSYLCSHVGVAVGGLVDVGVVDDEEDLYISILAPVCADSQLSSPSQL